VCNQKNNKHHASLPVNDLIPDTRLIADKMETGQDTSPATSVRGPPLSLTPRATTSLAETIEGSTLP
jgi:hypothetical protein